eukprot:3233676-Pleurochrysis_carterae.AAC.1
MQTSQRQALKPHQPYTGFQTLQLLLAVFALWLDATAGLPTCICDVIVVGGVANNLSSQPGQYLLHRTHNESDGVMREQYQNKQGQNMLYDAESDRWIVWFGTRSLTARFRSPPGWHLNCLRNVHEWQQWSGSEWLPGVELDCLPSPHRRALQREKGAVGPPCVDGPCWVEWIGPTRNLFIAWAILLTFCIICTTGPGCVGCCASDDETRQIMFSASAGCCFLLSITFVVVISVWGGYMRPVFVERDLPP